jgi:hypothetical protein
VNQALSLFRLNHRNSGSLRYPLCLFLRIWFNHLIEWAGARHLADKAGKNRVSGNSCSSIVTDARAETGWCMGMSDFSGKIDRFGREFGWFAMTSDHPVRMGWEAGVSFVFKGAPDVKKRQVVGLACPQQALMLILAARAIANQYRGFGNLFFSAAIRNVFRVMLVLPPVLPAAACAAGSLFRGTAAHVAVSGAFSGKGVSDNGRPHEQWRDRAQVNQQVSQGE